MQYKLMNFWAKRKNHEITQLGCRIEIVNWNGAGFAGGV
jgi:hypothetical protein